MKYSMTKYSKYFLLTLILFVTAPFCLGSSVSNDLISPDLLYPAVADPSDSLIPFDTIKGTNIDKGIYYMPLKTNAWHRGSFDFYVKMDLSNSTNFSLDISFSQDAVGTAVLYFHSGDGWYSMSGTEIRLKDDSVRRYTFELAKARAEGTPGPLSSVDIVRLAFYPKVLADFSARPIALTEQKASVLLVMEDKLFEQKNRFSFLKQVRNAFQSGHVACKAVKESEVTPNLIKQFPILVLPYQEKLKPETTKLFCDYMKNGGFFLAFYSVPKELIETLGFNPLTYRRMSDLNIQLASMRFVPNYRANFGDFLPEAMRQASHNIEITAPKKVEELDEFLARKENRPRILADWYDADGKKTPFPAVLASGRGLFFSHVLNGDDLANKTRFLLIQALQRDEKLRKDYILSLWRQIFLIGRMPGENETKRLNEIMTATIEKLNGFGWTKEKLTRLVKGELPNATFQDYAKLCRDLPKVREKIAKEYIASLDSPKVEARFWWEHSGMGPYPGDWDRTMRELAEAGFNGIVTNMLWGGAAFYKSDFLPAHRNLEKYGDQVEQAVRAGKKYGIEVHIWKVNFNMLNTPKEFIEKMRAEGRTQRSISGEEKDWLCPSNPLNQQLEIDSMLEVAKKYEINGIHFDYIRYDGSNFCFCDGCRKRFAEHYFKKTGKKVADLQQEFKGNPALRDEFDQWRADQIATIVRTVHERVNRECPKRSLNESDSSGTNLPLCEGNRAKSQKNLNVSRIKVSAAVFRDYPNCKKSVAQDWVHWVQEGWLDFICPMDYTNSNSVFENWVKTQKEYIGGKIPFYPGIGLWSSGSRHESDQTALQIKMTREYGAQGFTIFALNPRTAETQLQDFKIGPTKEKAVVPHSIPKK